MTVRVFESFASPMLSCFWSKEGSSSHKPGFENFSFQIGSRWKKTRHGRRSFARQICRNFNFASFSLRSVRACRSFGRDTLLNQGQQSPNNEIFDCYCGSSGCWCRKRVSIERLCFRGPKDGVPSRLQVCWKRLFSHYRLLFLLLQPIAAGSRHYRLALALRLLYSDELMFAQQLRSMLSQIQHHLLWEGEDSRRPTQKAAALSLKM